MSDDESTDRFRALHERESASFGTEPSTAGSFDIHSAHIRIETPLDRLFSDEIQRPRNDRDKEDALVIEHEITHFTQHCSTVYGVSGFIARTSVKMNLLIGILDCIDGGQSLVLPMWDWFLVPEGTGVVPTIPATLQKALRSHRHYTYMRLVHDGGYLKKLILRKGGELGTIVGSRFGDIYHTRMPVVYNTHETPKVPDWKYLDNPGAMQGIVADKLVRFYDRSSPHTHAGLSLGARAIEEAWALLFMEASDTLFSFLYSDGKGCLNPFDQHHAAAKHDEKMDIYTACTNLCTEILGEEHYYPLIPFLVRLYDFCLTYSSFLTTDGSEMEADGGATPDYLMLRSVRWVAEHEGDMKMHEPRRQEMTRGIVFDDVFDRLSASFGFKQRELHIRQFLNGVLMPFIDGLEKLKWAALEMELKYLRLCARALELRLDTPNVFCNPMDLANRATIREFVGESLKSGIFLRDAQNNLAGDVESIRRWISDDILDQLMYTESAHCPIKRTHVRCPDELPVCSKPIPAIIAQCRKTGHKCMLSDFIGRTWLADISFDTIGQLVEDYRRK